MVVIYAQIRNASDSHHGMRLTSRFPASLTRSLARSRFRSVVCSQTLLLLLLPALLAVMAATAAPTMTKRRQIKKGSPPASGWRE